MSERLRAVIEKFEPGVHRFEPYAIPAGDPPPVLNRYKLVIGNNLAATSIEHTTWKKESNVLWRPTGSIDSRIVFDARAIGSRHLWTEHGFTDRHFVSDQLFEAMLAAGMTGLLVDHYDQTDTHGAYQALPRSKDRVYVLHCPIPINPKSPHYTIQLRAKLLDGDIENILFADPEISRQAPQLLLRGIGSRLERGFRIDPTHVPTKVEYWQNCRGLPTVLFRYGDVPLTVSESFRSIVESFEPDTHQFLPIDFVSKNGGLIERRYVFVVCTDIDSVSREHTQMLFNGVTWHNPRNEYAVVVYDRRATAGRHVWRDKRTLYNNIHYSAELAEAVHAAGLDVWFAAWEMK